MDALAAPVGAQEHRGGHAPHGARVQRAAAAGSRARPARRASARSRPRARTGSGTSSPAISTSRRGTRIASSPRSTAGNVVVALSSAALNVPISAFAATAREHRPGRPRDRDRPERERPAARPHERHQHADRQHQRQHHPHPPPQRAQRHARDTPRTPRAPARTPPTPATAASGVDTATSVTPTSPTIFARGSSRCTRLRGIPGRAIGRARAPRPAHVARPPARDHGEAGARAANTPSTPTNPASPVASRVVLHARERVAGDRRLLLHACSRPWSRNALLRRDALQPVGRRRRERRHRRRQADRPRPAASTMKVRRESRVTAAPPTARAAREPGSLGCSEAPHGDQVGPARPAPRSPRRR